MVGAHTNRTLDFVFTSFCPICDGQVLRMAIPMFARDADTLAWVRDTRCKLCGIPMSGMDFQDLPVPVAGGNYFLMRAGVCL